MTRLYIILANKLNREIRFSYLRKSERHSKFVTKKLHIYAVDSL